MTKSPTVKDAKVTTWMAWRRFGPEPFRVDTRPTPEALRKVAALRLAERQGWVWFMLPDRACVTQDGRRALAEYGVEP